MIIIDWFKGLFSSKTGVGCTVEGYSNSVLELYYKKFAIDSVVSLIANALVMSEFQTLENGKEVKKNNYYLFNIEPNKNQNAIEFWHEVVSKLIYENECLIIQLDDELFVADEFTTKTYLKFEDRYEGVVARDFSFDKNFNESEVLYLKLNNESIKKLIDGMYSEYGKLISASIASYKKANGTKGILTLDTLFSQQEDAQQLLDDLFENKFKKYFENPNAVLHLEEGMHYEEKQNQSPTKNSRDIKALIDDVIEFVAAAFHVPSGLIRGNVAGVAEQTDNFLIFCVNPIAKLITGEVNRKMYGKELYLKRTYCKVDTQRIKDVDIKALSSAADLLFRIGVNSINDNKKMLGKESIDEKWADEHYVTKNYQSVLSINDNLKGGDTSGKKNSES